MLVYGCSCEIHIYLIFLSSIKQFDLLQQQQYINYQIKNGTLTRKVKNHKEKDKKFTLEKTISNKQIFSI